MTGYRYAPGTWWGVVAGGTALLLAPDCAPALVGRVLAGLRSGAAIGSVLGALAEATGGDLLRLPSFALLTTAPDGGRLVLRGVDANVGDRALAGVGVLTWSEHEVPAGDAVRITAGGTAAEPGLEIADGVVRCSVLESGMPGTAAPASPQAEPADTGATLLPAPAPARPEPPVPVPPPVQAVPVAAAPIAQEPAAARTGAAADGPDDADLTGLTDLLGGHTMIRSIADAARYPGQDAEAAPPSAAPPSVAQEDSDHDGLTMLRSDLQSDGDTSVRTAVGTLRLHDGRTCTVDRPVIIGRRPQATRVSAGEVPHLVTVDSPTQDISRSHVEIRPEGTHAVVLDLGTTNGTTLRRPGRPPQRLIGGDRHVLADQDVIDLGDDVLITYAAGGGHA